MRSLLCDAIPPRVFPVRGEVVFPSDCGVPFEPLLVGCMPTLHTTELWNALPPVQLCHRGYERFRGMFRNSRRGSCMYTHKRTLGFFVAQRSGQEAIGTAHLDFEVMTCVVPHLQQTRRPATRS